MNREEKQMLNALLELKEVYGVYGIKAEFEAEGARMDELISLRELVIRADLAFITKIGGCEAVHDMQQCKLLGATGIMAPMIETPFAMRKFASAAKRVYGNEIDSVEWIINAETKTCHANYKEILEAGNGFLNAVTVGRSDLSASMGIDRKDIESKPVFDATRDLLQMSKAEGHTTNFGGNIGIESIPFVIGMSDVAERFETRKVIITMDNNGEHLKKAIHKALNFELLWLLNKKNYYTRLSNEDEARIERMRFQLNK
ncbi:MAG: hypothetical protein K5864_02295 [Bacteroidales bacterium]|nr:hypothetical protein [Bacteroidales bacterium]